MQLLSDPIQSAALSFNKRVFANSPLYCASFTKQNAPNKHTILQRDLRRH